MFTLNVMATILDDYYNRNDSATRYLESKADCFPEKDEIVRKVECAAAAFNRLRFRVDSFWYGKSNAFTLLITLCENSFDLNRVNAHSLKAALVEFAEHTPSEYALAAKEGVNNKKERLLRAKYVRELVKAHIA